VARGHGATVARGREKPPHLKTKPRVGRRHPGQPGSLTKERQGVVNGTSALQSEIVPVDFDQLTCSK
jgi:hypothetical protein